jgi:hypothetical protein
MPVQARIMTRIASVFDRPSAFAFARNASHSSSSIRPALRSGEAPQFSRARAAARAQPAPAGGFF